MTWSAWASAGDSPTAVPVCRFFGTPGNGPNSHFYTVDANECAMVKQDPNWIFEAIAFYIDVPQNATCGTGTTPIYRSFYPGANLTLANHRFLPDLTMFEHMAPASILEGVVMCSPLSAAQIQADAVRLLEQSTFGPNDTLVAHVQSVGVQAFLDEQFAAPASRYPALKYVPAGQQATFCPTDPDPQCPRDYYSLFLLQNAFFADALAAADQLRQRVAFALSQILVTSGLDVNFAYGMATYQQIFLDNAFGNYEDILTRVTLSSVMGDYLNMVNNDKPAGDVSPNENYAREVLQLFSIGVWKLNPDGTQMLDATGAPIPTYDQDDTIEGFAHVFTGWTYPAAAGSPCAHPQSEELSRRHGSGRCESRQGREDAARRRDAAGGTIDPVGSRQRDPQHVHPSERRPVHRQAADPEAGHRRSDAAVRERASLPCSTTTARACAAT